MGKSKIITNKEREHLSVRIEGWATNGLNLGSYSVGKLYDSLSDAIEDARELWKIAHLWNTKQISIADQDGNRIWSYVNGKVLITNESGKLVEKK